MAGNALGTPNKAPPWTAWYPESAGRSAGAPLDLISADVRLDGRVYSRVTSSGERPERQPQLNLASHWGLSCERIREQVSAPGLEHC